MAPKTQAPVFSSGSDSEETQRLRNEAARRKQEKRMREKALQEERTRQEAEAERTRQEARARREAMRKFQEDTQIPLTSTGGIRLERSVLRPPPPPVPRDDPTPDERTQSDIEEDAYQADLLHKYMMLTTGQKGEIDDEIKKHYEVLSGCGIPHKSITGKTLADQYRADLILQFTAYNDGEAVTDDEIREDTLKYKTQFDAKLFEDKYSKQVETLIQIHRGCWKRMGLTLKEIQRKTQWLLNHLTKQEFAKGLVKSTATDDSKKQGTVASSSRNTLKPPVTPPHDSSDDDAPPPGDRSLPMELTRQWQKRTELQERFEKSMREFQNQEFEHPKATRELKEKEKLNRNMGLNKHLLQGADDATHHSDDDSINDTERYCNSITKQGLGAEFFNVQVGATPGKGGKRGRFEDSISEQVIEDDEMFRSLTMRELANRKLE